MKTKRVAPVVLVVLLAGILIISSVQVYARNITAFIHFNEEAIKQDTHLGDMWFTVDGNNVTNYYFDMSDWVYGDSSEPNEDLFKDGRTRELILPDNATKICFEETETDSLDYKACGFIHMNQTEFHVIYPASWQPDPND